MRYLYWLRFNKSHAAVNLVRSAASWGPRSSTREGGGRSLRCVSDMIKLPAWKLFPNKFIWRLIFHSTMSVYRFHRIGQNFKLWFIWLLTDRQKQFLIGSEPGKKNLHPMVAWNDSLSLYQSPPTVRGQTQEQDGEQRDSSLGAHGPIRQQWRTTAPAASVLKLFMGQMFECATWPKGFNDTYLDKCEESVWSSFMTWSVQVVSIVSSPKMLQAGRS